MNLLKSLQYSEQLGTLLAAVIIIFGILSIFFLPIRISASEVSQLDPSTIATILKAKKGVVVVEFSSAGCTACDNLQNSKLLERLSDSYPGGEITVVKVKSKSLNQIDIKAVTSDIGITNVKSFPTIDVFSNGVEKGALGTDITDTKLLDKWISSLHQYAGVPLVTVTTASNPDTAATQKVQKPDSDGNCKLVLVTIQTKGTGIDDCNNIGFYTYLNAVIDQLVPYIMIVALIMITFSGFQYMMGGAAGDVKSARARITGILGAIIFFFLIRLILNQIAPGLDLKGVSPPAPVPAPAPITKPDPQSAIRFLPGLDGSLADIGTNIQLGAVAGIDGPLTYTYTTPDNSVPTLIGTATAPNFTYTWDTSQLDDNSYALLASASAQSKSEPAKAIVSVAYNDSEGDGGNISDAEDILPADTSMSAEIPTPITLADVGVNGGQQPPPTCYLRSHGTGSNGVPLYKQNKYCNILYPHEKSVSDCGASGRVLCTLKTSGCGLMAAAMVLEFYGKFDGSLQSLATFSITHHFRTESGTAIDFFPSIAKSHGLYGGVIVSEESKKTAIKWNKIIDFLKNKRPVILSGSGSKETTPFTVSGHFVVATGIDTEGNISINDSKGDARYDNKTYPESIIESSYNRAAVIYKPR